MLLIIYSLKNKIYWGKKLLRKKTRAYRDKLSTVSLSHQQ